MLMKLAAPLDDRDWFARYMSVASTPAVRRSTALTTFLLGITSCAVLKVRFGPTNIGRPRGVLAAVRLGAMALAAPIRWPALRSRPTAGLSASPQLAILLCSLSIADGLNSQSIRAHSWVHAARNAFSPVPSSVDVAIIGGGPCGLATAIALSKAPVMRGCTVRVFERDYLEPKGAAVSLSPLAWRALEAIDATVAAQIRREGSPVVAVEMRPLHRAAADSSMNGAGDSAGAGAGASAHQAVLALWSDWLRLFGLGPRVQTTFLWHDVRSLLAQRARQLLGARVLCSGYELVGLEPSAEQHGERAGITLRFRRSGARHAAADGNAGDSSGGGNGGGSGSGEDIFCHARLVLACDGVQSAARAAAPSGPRAAAVLLDEEKSVWRGVAPGVDVRGVATFYKDGGGRMGLLFPAGKGRGASWTVTAPAVPGRARDGADARARLWAALGASEPSSAGGGAAGSTANGAQRAVVDERFAAALAASSNVVEHRLVSRNWDAPWHSGVEHLAYLGDAAHPLRPTGEGLALALEDAWTMGRLAADAPTADAFLTPRTLRSYESARLARVRAVAEATSAAAKASYGQQQAQPQPQPAASSASTAAAGGRQRADAASAARAPSTPPRAPTLSEAVAAHPLHEAFGPL